MFSKSDLFRKFCDANGLTAAQVAEKVYLPVRVIEGWLDGQTMSIHFWTMLSGHYPEMNTILEKAVCEEIEDRRQRFGAKAS